MALFCSAIRKDSVSLLKFSFCSHIRVFSCEISPFCHLKYPYNCFSLHFCFLVYVFILFVLILSVLLLSTVIHLSLFFLMLSLSPCIDASMLSSMLASPLSPSFLDIYCLSMSFPTFKALCIVINFFCPLIHLFEFFPCPF